MRHKILAIVTTVVIVLTLATPVLANPPDPNDPNNRPSPRILKPLDEPNPLDYQRMQERRRLLEAGEETLAASQALTGTDHVLVILVEFAGTDVFTWTAPITPTDYRTGSMWDPLGIADPSEAVYDGDELIDGDCSNIITQTAVFTYSGPLHNELPRPLSSAPEEASATTLWTSDFSPEWFEGFMFDNGVEISYTYQSGEPFYASFLGQSVADYWDDMSNGNYSITGDVIGWVGVPHSTWWYGADECPGRRSPFDTSISSSGAIPNAGSTRSFARDALDAVNAISDTIPGFDWANYDLDGDGIIDRLWFVHAGYGEEDQPVLLNRDPITTSGTTFYGEAAIWSHSSSGFSPPYTLTQGVHAGAYIVNPENGGMDVFSHEAGHNMGADDLYSYNTASPPIGETSAGFWTLMSDSWTGHPIGMEPQAVDPWHLDSWGWLDPFVVDDPSQCYDVTIGQASSFDDNTATGDVYRGVKIPLPTGVLPPEVPSWQGDYYWWGGDAGGGGVPHNAMMTSVAPFDLTSATAATLTFDLAYEIEDDGWDFLWVQVSTDGVTWPYTDTLTNADTQCDVASGWVGPDNGFPDTICSVGIGGFYGTSAYFPVPDTQVFDLSPYVGQSIYVRFWYMSDWYTGGQGPFVDNVAVEADGATIFADDAESGDANWTYTGRWVRMAPQPVYFSHNYYLQWRNVNDNGGYDSTLGEERWRFGPANTGLLVWYNNNYYENNEIEGYLEDFPSFGPKGRMLVVDSHPEPYRLPEIPDSNYGEEHKNLTSRGLMGDAPFTLQDTTAFSVTGRYVGWPTETVRFEGRPAVSTFNDALGYYPGIEGPGVYGYYSTVDFDASVVIPAKSEYSVRAGPGYPGFHIIWSGDFYFEPDGWYGFWGWYGGTGNPGDENVQYGWQVELIEEAADHTWGKVRVCNVQPIETEYTPMEIGEAGTHLITYTLTLNNEGTLAQTHWFTFTLDPLLTFVSASWAPSGTLVSPTYGWAGTVPTGTTTFTLVASVTLEPGSLVLPGTDITTKLEHNDFMNPLYVEDMVTVARRAFIYLPVVMRNSAGGTAVLP